MMCVLYVISQNGGSYVLAVDAGRERILSVWQWQWGHLLGKVAVSWPLCGYCKSYTEPNRSQVSIIQNIQEFKTHNTVQCQHKTTLVLPE